MLMKQHFKKEINNSLIETQETTNEQKPMKQKCKEITKADKPEDRKPRKEIRHHRLKHHQQNARDRRENLRGRRYHRKY